MIKMMFVAILFITVAVGCLAGVIAILFPSEKYASLTFVLEEYFMKYALVAAILSALVVAGFVLIECFELIR